MKAKRPRSVNGALAEWPTALDAVYTNPTSANLDALVALLDVMDGDVCRRWGSQGHASRLETLLACRRAARDANGYVSSQSLVRAQVRGEAAAAAKRERSAA